MNTECLVESSYSSPRVGRHRRFVLSVATPSERETLYRILRHVNAPESEQIGSDLHGPVQHAFEATDVYLVVKAGLKIADFISITPPAQPAGGSRAPHDMLFGRALPFPFDGRLYKIRLSTLPTEYRARELAYLLIYAAFRWVDAHGGTRIVAIASLEMAKRFVECGLDPVDVGTQNGARHFKVLQAGIPVLRERITRFKDVLGRLRNKTDWQLNIPFSKPAACFHGGAFFDAVGAKFEALERSAEIINADVLDAWYPPSPKVVAALQTHLSWLLRTSPPTRCEGLVDTIAAARGVPPECILPGAGSSDLIFRALRHWLNPSGRALILDPTYGEYAHVLEKVIHCTVDRLSLSRRENFEVDLQRLEAALAEEYDLVVLVNPNSPTGRHVSRKDLEEVLSRAPGHTRVWVDETYIEYAGPNQSLEPFAARSENILVCKSLSKVYALSGARAAYLCAGPNQLEELRSITPPWAVSLPAQVAAVRALQDPAYYAARYAETRAFRESLAAQLCSLGLEIIPGVANFVLGFLPQTGPDARTVVRRCQKQELFLRDASVMGSQLGAHALRIAVKDGETNDRMIGILAANLGRHQFVETLPHA